MTPLLMTRSVNHDTATIIDKQRAYRVFLFCRDSLGGWTHHRHLITIDYQALLNQDQFVVALCLSEPPKITLNLVNYQPCPVATAAFKLALIILFNLETGYTC